MQIARGMFLKYTKTSLMSHYAFSATKEERRLIPVKDATVCDWRLCRHMEGHFIGTKCLCSLMRFMEAGILYHSPIIASPNTKVSLFPYFMNVMAMLLLTHSHMEGLLKRRPRSLSLCFWFNGISIPPDAAHWWPHTFLLLIHCTGSFLTGSPPKHLSYSVFPPWAACDANKQRLCKQGSGLHLSS